MRAATISPKSAGHLLFLPLYIWILFGCVQIIRAAIHPMAFTPEGILKGGDFVHFYILGTVANRHAGELLYDARAQLALSDAIAGHRTAVFFLPVYGPQVSLLFAPLARLSYPVAVETWSLLTTVIYFSAAMVFLPRRLDSAALVSLALVLLNPAFFELTAYGQTSALALGCFVLAYQFWRKGRLIATGACIGLLAYKPQLALVVAVLMLFHAEWRMIAGAAVSVAVQFAAAASFYGLSALLEYERVLRQLRALAGVLEPHPEEMHSIAGFFNFIGGGAGLSLVAGAVSWMCIALTVWAWRRSSPLSLRLGMLLLATVLVSPHLTGYDLVLIVPSLLLAIGPTFPIEGAAASRVRYGLVAACWSAPILGKLSPLLHLQPTTICLGGLLAMYIHALTQSGPALQGSSSSKM